MIKKLKIPYDKSFIRLKIPEKNVANLINIKETSINSSNKYKLENALQKSNGKPLEELVTHKSAVLIIEDSTRDVPFEDRFKAVFPRMQSAQSIKVLLATGTHDGENDGNYQIRSLIEKQAKQHNLPLDKVIIHNCHSDQFYLAGTTSIGNDVFVNQEIQDAEVIVIFSDMKNHYFAGYSNPLKSLLPGICKYETIERNHALTLNDKSTFGHHPLHPDKTHRDNPLAQDMYEGFKLIAGNRPVFVLATICKNNQILWTKAGSLQEVTTEGIKQVDSMSAIYVEPTDRMIVSSGGYPNDESLYITQRALELTKNAVNDGGEILFISGCANGIGPAKSIKNFYEPLREDINKILNKLQKKYIMYSHKTYKFARLIKRMSAIHLYSELEQEQVESIHLKSVKSPQDVVDRWIKENESVKINIFTEGNKAAVYQK